MFVDHFSWSNAVFTVLLVVGMAKWQLWRLKKDLYQSLEQWAAYYQAVGKEQVDEQFAAVDRRLDRVEEKINGSVKSG